MLDIQGMTQTQPILLAGGSVGVLIAHGLTGTPQSVGFVADYLAREGGLTVMAPRVAGHGTTPEDLARTTAEDWIRSMEEAARIVEERCSRLYVAGLSLGGTLALYLAGMYRRRFAGVITVNAPVFLHLHAFASLAFAPDLPSWIPGFGSDIKRRGVTELAYPVIPTASVRQVYALMGVASDLVERIRCPALLFQSRIDHVVAPDNGIYLLDRVGAEEKRLVWLENSYHVATLDNDRELIGREVLAFVREHGLDRSG